MNSKGIDRRQFNTFGRIVIPCEKCPNQATEKHHLFSNTKWARKLYGTLLDRPSNIQHLCYSCHHDKPLDKDTEQEFCKKIGIDPRSKISGGKRK